MGMVYILLLYGHGLVVEACGCVLLPKGIRAEGLKAILKGVERPGFG